MAAFGGCPGTRDSNTCSGITQNTWDFSQLLEGVHALAPIGSAGPTDVCFGSEA